jgi:hypothetical protein
MKGKRASHGQSYVIFDDGVFSGIQQRRIMGMLAGHGTPIHALVAYSDERSARMARGMIKTISCFSGKPLKEIISPESWISVQRTAEWFGNNVEDRVFASRSAHAVYFDHKVPDSASSFPVVYAGARPIIKNASTSSIWASTASEPSSVEDALLGKSTCLRHACRLSNNPELLKVSDALSRVNIFEL